MPYFENMKYLTQKPVTITLSEIPWGASPCHCMNHPRGCDRVQEGGLFWTWKTYKVKSFNMTTKKGQVGFGRLPCFF